jgi:tetratricopeptide (TPR) repeat protein
VRLDNRSFNVLYAALDDAFNTYDELAMLCALCYLPLADITEPTAKGTAIQRLIEHCAANDALEDFIVCLQQVPEKKNNKLVAALRFDELTTVPLAERSADQAAQDVTRLHSVPVGAFVGREHALTALKRLVEDETKRTSQRPVALVGMGGVGKTSLARELMRQLIGGYPGGELILERPAEGHPKTAREVFSEWASELELPPEREYTAAEMRGHLTASYHGRPRICLIDDVGVDDLHQVTVINDALPVNWTRLLTTRREKVGRKLGAVIYRVRGMLRDDAMALISERLHSAFDHATFEGVAGVDRAIAEHAETLEEFIDRVDGLPLALHLGIGTCNSLAKIPKVSRRLFQSLERDARELKAGALHAADGNDSLAASLSISLEELEQDSSERNVDWDDRFRALGVLPDGSDYDADFLHALWGDPSDDIASEEALDALVWASLLEMDQVSGDYSIHPVVRSFAAGSLAEDRELLAATRKRYHRVVIDRAEQIYATAPERWTVPDPLYPHLTRVLPALKETLTQHTTLDLDTLAAPDPGDRKAFVTLQDRGTDDVALGAELADAFKRAVLRRPWRGPVGTDVLKLGVACARALGDSVGEVEYLSRLGAQYATREPELAEEYFATATRLARQRDAPNLGAILTDYAEFRRTVADAEAALELAHEALEIHQRGGDDRLAAQTRMVLGEILWRLSRLDEAEEQYTRARPILERADDKQGVADLLNKLASVEFNRGGRYEQAIALFKQALAQHEALNDRIMKAEDLNDLGACYRYLGEYERAESYFKQALELNEAVGNRRLQAINICNIAGALYAQGQYDLAQQRAEEGRTLGEDVKDKVPQLWGLVWEGLAWKGMGEPDTAERFVRQAVELGRTFDNPRGLAGALARLGALLADDLDRPEEGAALIDEAIRLLTDYNLATTFSNVTLADLQARRDRLSETVGK